MIYLNLKVHTLRSPEYIGSEPTARATWLNILCYCCEQENNGIIKGCAAWKDRQWQQTCGVTLAEVNESTLLWSWLGDDLLVTFYPSDKQDEIQAKREAGRRGGKLSGKKRTEKASGEAQIEASGEAELQAELQGVLEADLERKGKERNGIGKKRKLVVADASATSDEDWLKELQGNPAYQSISVTTEYAKMVAWCSTNRRQPTRRRFVNWLNRCEKPISLQNVAHSVVVKQASPWESRQAIEAAKKQIERIKVNPANYFVPDHETPWERRLKQEARQKVTELKDNIERLNAELALLGKGGAA